eukprot:TRINITY_DN9681_c0_g1_i5.p2 TRINITY_DN9681_c0_g1~~TRINITY_DN9681_c0_g1_i5.p2  ORF type:complete len:119 (+),score=44.17 TRINITY_DN9681_c0_g1_i5:178-534(+)
MPSLELSTNLALGDAKAQVLRALSQAVAEVTKKPEKFVMIAVHDESAMLYGGSDAPCAVAHLHSIGAISQASNAELQRAVTAVLAPLGLPADRMYIFFHDAERANVGWDNRTFACPAN